MYLPPSSAIACTPVNSTTAHTYALHYEICITSSYKLVHNVEPFAKKLEVKQGGSDDPEPAASRMNKTENSGMDIDGRGSSDVPSSAV
jgi:hypothetical protein